MTTTTIWPWSHGRNQIKENPMSESNEEFGPAICCRKRKKGFSVYLSWNSLAVEVSLTGTAGNATAIVDDSRFRGIALECAQSPEPDRADPLLDWLVDHDAGEDDFRRLLADCMGGKADALKKTADRQRREARKIAKELHMMLQDLGNADTRLKAAALLDEQDRHDEAALLRALRYPVAARSGKIIRHPHTWISQACPDFFRTICHNARYRLHGDSYWLAGYELALRLP